MRPLSGVVAGCLLISVLLFVSQGVLPAVSASTLIGGVLAVGGLFLIFAAVRTSPQTDS
jgi:hypothetical protein